MADSLTFAVVRVIQRVKNNGGRWAAFSVDGELKLTRPGTRTYKMLEVDAPDGLIGIYDDGVTIEPLVADMKCFFGDK